MPVCKCGHDRDAHRHYRAGSDCGRCGSANCERYRPRAPWTTRLRNLIRKVTQWSS
jgi:hypothetical protein